ncbi:hypothetical protein SNEBB_000239 [Seison nebaliae]|nr:hypothetical protein SNEBB_000239 [Seison nebaliae]
MSFRSDTISEDMFTPSNVISTIDVEDKDVATKEWLLEAEKVFVSKYFDGMVVGEMASINKWRDYYLTYMPKKLKYFNRFSEFGITKKDVYQNLDEKELLPFFFYRMRFMHEMWMNILENSRVALVYLKLNINNNLLINKSKLIQLEQLEKCTKYFYLFYHKCGDDQKKLIGTLKLTERAIFEVHQLKAFVDRIVKNYHSYQSDKELLEKNKENKNDSYIGSTILTLNELYSTDVYSSMKCKKTKLNFIHHDNLLDFYIKLENNNILYQKSCQLRAISFDVVINQLKYEKFKKFEVLTNFISILNEYSLNENSRPHNLERSIITEILLDKKKSIPIQMVRSFEEIIDNKILKGGSFNVKFHLDEIRQLCSARTAETGWKTSQQLVVQLVESHSPEFYPTMKLAALLYNLPDDDLSVNDIHMNNDKMNIEKILLEFYENDEITHDSWRCQLTNFCSIMHIDNLKFFQHHSLISMKVKGIFLFYANLLETVWDDKPSALVLRMIIGDINQNYDASMNVIRFDGLTNNLKDENAIFRYNDNIDIGLMVFEKLLIDIYYLVFHRKLFHDNLISLNFAIVKRWLALHTSQMDKIVELVIILMKNILIYRHEYRKEKWHVLMKDIPWMVQEIEKRINNNIKLRERLSKEKQLCEEFSNWYNHLPMQPHLNVPPLFTCYHVTEQDQLSFIFDDVIREKEIQKRSQIGDVIICNENENEEILKANDLNHLDKNILYDNTVTAFLAKCTEYLCECSVCDPQRTRCGRISKIRERIINRTDEMKIKDTLSSEKSQFNDTLRLNDEKRRDSTGSVGSFMNKENDNNCSFNTSAILSTNMDNDVKLEKLNEEMNKISMKINQAKNNDILIYKKLKTAKEIVEKMMEMESLEKELNRSTEQDRMRLMNLNSTMPQPLNTNENFPQINLESHSLNTNLQQSNTTHQNSYSDKLQPINIQELNKLNQINKIDKPKKKEKLKNSFFDDDDDMDNFTLPNSKNVDQTLNLNMIQQPQQIPILHDFPDQDHSVCKLPDIPQQPYPNNYDISQQTISISTSDCPGNSILDHEHQQTQYAYHPISSDSSRLTIQQNPHIGQPFPSFQPPLPVSQNNGNYDKIGNPTRRSSTTSTSSHKSGNLYLKNQNDLFQQHYGHIETLSLEQQTKLLLPPGLDMTDAFNPNCFIPPPPEEDNSQPIVEEEKNQNTNNIEKKSSSDVKKRNAFYEESEEEKINFKKQMDQDKISAPFWSKWLYKTVDRKKSIQ